MKLFEPCIIYLLFSFNILTVTLTAQSFQTYQQFGNQGFDKILEMEALPDGSFVAAGTFTEGIEIGDSLFIALGSEDVWIARFDADLEIIWAMSGGSTRQDEIADLQVAPDGSIYLTGSFREEVIFGNFRLTPTLSNESIFIIRMNSNGEALNGTTLSGKFGKAVNELAIDMDSNIFLVGNFSDTLLHADTFFVSNYENNFFTAKINADFEIDWFQQVEGDGFSNGNTLTLLPSGEIVAAGEFRGNMLLNMDSIRTESADEDLFFAKFSPEGEPIFLQKAGGVFPAFCKKVVSDLEGNFYLSGHHRGVIKLDETLEIQTDGLDDNFYILAYQSDGVPIWGKSYGSAENSRITDLQLFDNQLFIAGFYDADMLLESQFLPVGDGFSNGFFGGFSKLNGSLNWVQTTTGNDSQTSRCLAPISATEVIGGFDFSNEISFGNDLFSTNGFFDFFITKMNAPAPTQTNETNDFDFSFYPNPTNDFLYISVGKGKTKLTDFQVEIFSNLGTKISQFSNQKKLDLSFLPKGIYFFKIMNSEGIFQTEKILKF